MGQCCFSCIFRNISSKYLQTQDSKLDSIQNRINHLIELQELRGEVYHKSQKFSGKNEIYF